MYGYGAYPESKFQLAIKEQQKFISLPSFSFTLAGTNRVPIFLPALHREALERAARTPIKVVANGCISVEIPTGVMQL